jgi:hypothetical protein
LPIWSAKQREIEEHIEAVEVIVNTEWK